MSDTHNKTELARHLPRRQTAAERALWTRLQNRQLGGIKFRRQQPVGPYIIDLVSLKSQIVIEVDGGQHGEDSEGKRDNERTGWLESRGYDVLRFWNNEVLLNMDAVLERITEVTT